MYGGWVIAFTLLALSLDASAKESENKTVMTEIATLYDCEQELIDAMFDAYNLDEEVSDLFDLEWEEVESWQIEKTISAIGSERWVTAMNKQFE